MSDHFNKLSPAEAERLALLSEEIGECQHVIGKILRHGYNSTNPVKKDGVTNRELLDQELGDVQYAVSLMVHCGDVRRGKIQAGRNKKALTVWRYLHHQSRLP